MVAQQKGQVCKTHHSYWAASQVGQLWQGESRLTRKPLLIWTLWFYSTGRRPFGSPRFIFSSKLKGWPSTQSTPCLKYRDCFWLPRTKTGTVWLRHSFQNTLCFFLLSFSSHMPTLWQANLKQGSFFCPALEIWEAKKKKKKTKGEEREMRQN